MVAAAFYLVMTLVLTWPSSAWKGKSPSMTEHPMIHAIDLHKRFGQLAEVLRGVSFEVARGEVIAVIGPSGSGKSTFLRCLNHLETIERGAIEIEGVRWSRPTRMAIATICPRPRSAVCAGRMGMVFQHFNLFPHLTVLQNLIEAPVTVKGLSQTPHRRPKPRSCCARSACSTSATVIPRGCRRAEAAGRDRARAGDAARHPAVRRADLGARPRADRRGVRTMRALADEHMTMVVVTHEMGFAREVASRVVFMDGGQVVEAGSPQQLFGSPQQPRTRASWPTCSEPAASAHRGRRDAQRWLRESVDVHDQSVAAFALGCIEAGVGPRSGVSSSGLLAVASARPRLIVMVPASGLGGPDRLPEFLGYHPGGVEPGSGSSTRNSSPPQRATKSLAQRLLQRPAHLLQHAVAHGVTEAVVDAL